MNCFLGIDTSNYTTSVALVGEDGSVVSNGKTPLGVSEGERGLRQSDALFAHVRNLPGALETIRGKNIIAIGVSAFPRDVEGSYMPCFLAGRSAAFSLSSALDVPVYCFSHQRGHIRAALYSANRGDLIGRRYIAIHLSGGTTEILLVENGKISLVGGTLDLNAGQLVDRVGVLLGLRFPCGKELSELAERGTAPEAPKVCVNGLECNFSGAENKAIRLLSSGVAKEDVAAYTVDFVKLTLDRLCENVRSAFRDIEIVCAGGVASNRVISRYIGEKYFACFASPEFSSDNACGAALLCRDEFLKGDRSI